LGDDTGHAHPLGGSCVQPVVRWYRFNVSGARHTVFLDSPCSWRPPGASPFRGNRKTVVRTTARDTSEPPLSPVAPAVGRCVLPPARGRPLNSGLGVLAW